MLMSLLSSKETSTLQHDDCLELPLTFLPSWDSRPEGLGLGREDYFGQRLLGRGKPNICPPNLQPTTCSYSIACIPSNTCSNIHFPYAFECTFLATGPAKITMSPKTQSPGRVLLTERPAFVVGLAHHSCSLGRETLTTCEFH